MCSSEQFQSGVSILFVPYSSVSQPTCIFVYEEKEAVARKWTEAKVILKTCKLSKEMRLRMLQWKSSEAIMLLPKMCVTNQQTDTRTILSNGDNFAYTHNA